MANDTINLPSIEVRKMPGNYLNLYIDGIEYWSMRGSKIAIKRYLKRTFDIDLLTDRRIKRNYTEYRTKKVAAKNGKQYFVKEKR